MRKVLAAFLVLILGVLVFYEYGPAISSRDASLAAPILPEPASKPEIPRQPDILTNPDIPPKPDIAAKPYFEPKPPQPLAGGDDYHLISAALARHGNSQQMRVSFFIDVVRSMERQGLPKDTAREVAVLLAANPKLDAIADLTIAGCLAAYPRAAGEDLFTAVRELIEYIEQPEQYAGRANEKLGNIGADLQRRISEKLRAGSHVAAERLIERALLDRLNPALGAKILARFD